MLLVWDENAWQDYLWWQAQDRKVLKRINTLLADIQRNGNQGIGRQPSVRTFAHASSKRNRLIFSYRSGWVSRTTHSACTSRAIA